MTKFRVGDAVTFPAVDVSAARAFVGSESVNFGWLVRKLPAGWVVMLPAEDCMVLLLVEVGDLRRLSRTEAPGVWMPQSERQQLGEFWGLIEFMHDTSAWVPGLCSIMGGFGFGEE